MDVYSFPGYYCVSCRLWWCHYHQPQTWSPSNWYSAEGPVWACLIIMGLGWEQGKGRSRMSKRRVSVREWGVMSLIDIQWSKASAGLSADIGVGARWGFEWGMYEGHNISSTSKGSSGALLELVVKGNCAIRAVSETKWCRYGKGTTVYSELANYVI